MSDFRLNVIAETQAAERKLSDVEEQAQRVEKARQINIEFPNYSDLSRNFNNLNKDIKNAANSIKEFYTVSSKLPVGPLKEINEVAGQLRAVGVAAVESSKGIGNAGSAIQGTLELAGRAADSLVGKLTRVAFSIYAISEAAKLAGSAFAGLFRETIGREIQLRETILKTQTTLASTNKVFADGREITDPYKKIVTLTSAVAERIDSIRERSIALAGVTSNEVIEVFGIVASQVGQIGGGLKEAEDLAINFAAALGTFGIPLYQARQEIGSILRGQITEDSYLAKSLGIRSEDIAKARSEVGGVVKFLEERLAASVAGQRIAAEGFAGVASNIKDLSELINQNFGRGLLDPLIDGLTKVFNFLFNIRNELFSIASLAGSAAGKLLSIGIGRTLGASGGTRRTQGGGGGAGSRGTTGERNTVQSAGTNASTVLKNVEDAIRRVALEVNKALSAVYLQLATLVERAANAVGRITEGLAALALGLLSLKLEQIKALIGAIEALSPALLAATRGFSGFLAMWGEFLKLPLVQELTQITANMRLLQLTGVMPLIKIGFVLKGVLENWARVSEFVIARFNALRAIIGGLIAYLGTLAVTAGIAGKQLLAAWQPANASLLALKTELQSVVVQLGHVGAAAQQVGAKLGSLNTQSKGASGGIVKLVAGFLRFNLLMLAISATLGIVLERFSAYKESQDKIASDKRAEEAVRRLQTTYKNVGDEADAATKRAKQFEESLVEAKYDEALQRLEDVRKKIEEIKDLSSDSATDFGDFFRRTFQLFNPANFDAFLDKRPNELFADAVLRRRRAQAREAEGERGKWAIEVNKRAAERDIQVQAQNRTNLEKEIGELRRQIDNDLFQQRQSLAQKEVEIFRLAGELRIKQIEKANEKLTEGEEGASRAALEALNNYIATRERGELEIEASKKTLAIEVANLEKNIADYQLDIAKKIAEIEKKSADYKRQAADAEQRAAGGKTPAAPGTTEGFRVGSTGSSSTGPHLDIRSPTGNKQAVIDEATAIIKAWQGQGLEYIELSNAKIDVKNMFDEAELRKALAKEQAVHGERAGGGAIDIAVPAGTLVPTPAGTPSWGGEGGWQATSLQTGNIFLHGQGTSVASPAGGRAAAPAAPAAPAAAAGSEMPEASEAAKNYANAVRSLAGAMERLRALQVAITEADTAEAFDRIAKSAFPQVAIEQYQDSLIEAAYNYDAVAASADKAFNPERIAIEVSRVSKLAISNRELGQIIEGINKRSNLSDTEKIKAIDAVKNKHAEYIRGLEREAQLKNSILTTQQATQFIADMQAQTRNIKNEIEEIKLRNRLLAEGMAPEFIDAELTKLSISREMERISAQLNEQLADKLILQDELQQQLEGAKDADKADLQKQLDEALADIERLRKQLRGVSAAGAAAASSVDTKAAAQAEPGQKLKAWIGSMQAELKDLEGLGVRVGQSITTSLGNSITNAVTGLIEGTTTVKEVFAGFLKDVGQILAREGAKMIAMYIAIGIAKIFAGLSGGGKGSGIFSGEGPVKLPSALNPLGGADVAGNFAPNFTFAEGGFVTGPTNAVIGEGGESEYVIPASKMGAAMARYAGGARGSSVIPQNGDSMAAGGNGGSSIFKLETVVINNVEYATVDQVRAMGQQAAQQGTQGGFTKSMRTLQNSRSQRSKLGLGR